MLLVGMPNDTTALVKSNACSLEGRNGNPLQHSCLENPMDREGLAGYSPQGRKESDTTE